jgi:[ribosomal protein S5]-alanine N-acetyltransferase
VTSHQQPSIYPVTLTASMTALREFTPDDADALFKVYGDPDATRHLSFEPRTLDHVQASSPPPPNPPRPGPAASTCSPSLTRGPVRSSARPVSPSANTKAPRSASRCARPMGHGKGRQTVRLLEHLGFSELGLHRLWGARSPLNTPSARTMHAAGMTEKGTIRGHLYTRGAWRDSIVDSILAAEYHPQPGEISTQHDQQPPHG